MTDARHALQAAGTAPKHPGDWVAAHILCMIDLRTKPNAALVERLLTLAKDCPYPGSRRYFETTLFVARVALQRHAEAAASAQDLLAQSGFDAGERQVLHLMKAHAEAARGDIQAARQSLAAASNVVPLQELIARRLQAEIERRYGLSGGRPLTHRADVDGADRLLIKLETDIWVSRAMRNPDVVQIAA